jgi:hypothetical protein
MPFSLAPGAQTLLVLAFTFAPVAQLDRAPDYESGGWGFDSLRVHQFSGRQCRSSVGFFRHKPGQNTENPVSGGSGGFFESNPFI